MPDVDLTHGDDVPVINLDKQAAEAYRMGYSAFADFGTLCAPDDGDVEHVENLSHHKESARWANHTHPRLRCMAGNADPTGKGTWTGQRPVVILREPEVEDEPAPGKLADSVHISRLLVDWWDRGALDAMEGDDMDPDTGEITAV